MSSRSPRPIQHLFVSPTGEALPRWLQAFPSAVIAGAGALIKPSSPAVLVWLRLDEKLPALEQLAAVRKVVGPARVVVLADRPDGEEALAMFSAGVRGYCNAHSTAANLRQVTNVVQAGGLWIGEALMQRLLASTQAALARVPVTALSSGHGARAPGDGLATLTKRELEVAHTVANGSSNKEIARHLGITERTVKAHVGSIFQKLKARDRLHLALIINGRRLA